MPVGAQLLIVAVIVLAAWIVTHVALVARVVGVAEITRRQRWLALVPLFTPFVGWQVGKRRHVVLWLCLLAGYGIVRIALSVR